jgi:dTDP-4-amino-4,6-dideoxygalactose transaminase
MARNRVPLFARESSLTPIKAEILRRVGGIIDSGTYIQGEDVAAFEQEFASYLGREHCVSVANGTDALMIGLIALGVSPGDEVVVPAVTFFATAEAVAAVGARPVFADVDPRTWTLTASTVEPVITASTTAIIPVHIFGNPAPMDELGKLADSYGLPLLEDAAQAAGASYGGKMAGAIGTAAAFSFYPGKNLGAIGDAGALVTDDPEVAAMARLLREHGSADRRIHTEVGFNSRMDSIQAAALRIALPFLDEWTESRRLAADSYRGSGMDELVGLPTETEGGSSCHHLYVITSDRRDELQVGLEEAGVETRAYYSPAIPSQPAMRAFAPAGLLPGMVNYENSALAIPMGESLGVTGAETVAEAIRTVLA